MNVFRVRGMAFIPDNKKPDMDGESDAKTYSRVKLSRRKILKGDVLTLSNCVSDSLVRLAYIYSKMGHEMESRQGIGW
jgi:hypothetical protein